MDSAISYLEAVESYFLSAIRKGLSLRPADIDLIRDWERRGVPLDVVRRGISGGIRKFLETAEPHAPLPAALRYYRASVDEAFQAWQRSLAQGRVPVGTARRETAGPDLAGRATEALAAARDAATDGARVVFQDALDRLAAMPSSASLVEVLADLDDRIARGLIDLAPPAERAAAEAAVRQSVERARARGVGPAGLADVERAARAEVAAERLGFQSVVDAVL